jgi:HEXXH motif-containing protein
MGPTIDLDTLYEAFSFPREAQEHDLDVVVPMIVREYTSGLTEAFVDRHRPGIAKTSTGLVEYLDGWTNGLRDRAAPQPCPPKLGWDHAFGDAYRTVAVPGADHARTAAAIAMHLGACGVTGAWEVAFGEQDRPRWDVCLLPPADWLAVDSTSTRTLVVQRRAQGERALELTATTSGHWIGTTDELLRVDRCGLDFTLLTQDALSLRDFDDLRRRSVRWIDPRMLDVFAAAIDIIKDFTPEYLPWIARTLHQFFLLAPRDHIIESGSVEHYLGLVHLTAHAEPLPVAELLVHEASHQYMNLLTKIEPLDDGSDGKSYWSPAVNVQRPLAKIVAALHAFGNVLLFYRRCAQRGLNAQAECRRQEQLLSSWFDDLVPPIMGNDALSPTGRALCLPLLEALNL